MYNSQTPIDIHCSKLVDWLVQRRYCKKDWGENLALIRRKIKAALKDMPENEEIKELLIGTKLDYLKSKRIVDILKTTEASSKNIFGYYSSQRMKDWQDIVYSYERDYIYLAEMATDLIRETNYEVPGVRKTIQKLNREKEDIEKQRQNLIRRAQQFNSEHQKLALSYGINGVNVPQELAEQSKTLVTVMNEIVELARNLKDGVEYYKEYASSTSRQDANKFVPLITHVIAKRNTTVYEWKYGGAPERIVVEEKAPSSTGTSNPSEIELVNDEIDFGDESEIPSSESSSGFVHVNQSDNGNGSNVDETYVNIEQGGDSQSGCDSSDKVARGDEAKPILEYRRTRNQFLNNLYELDAFFMQMSSELSNTDDLSNAFLSETNTRSRRYDMEGVDKVLVQIRQIMGIMNKDKNKILFQVNDSPSFVENLAEKLAAKLKQASECTTKAELLDDRLKEIEAQKRETELLLKKSIALAKELQQKVESSLSEIYSGRVINIMGCVS